MILNTKQLGYLLDDSCGCDRYRCIRLTIIKCGWIQLKLSTMKRCCSDIMDGIYFSLWETQTDESCRQLFIIFNITCFHGLFLLVAVLILECSNIIACRQVPER